MIGSGFDPDSCDKPRRLRRGGIAAPAEQALIRLENRGLPALGTQRGRLFKSLVTLALVFSIWISAQPGWSASGDKPVNFIFLVDVSGSMVSKSTMVTDEKGAPITLFEALRAAVKNIVADSRLIRQGSRIAFITFGTDVTEKTDWPTSISTDEDRAKLVQLIGDSATLAADRKGDTYMGGALNQALTRASDFLRSSDPCTTTFILMLTDGWDEPPAMAQYRVQDVAQKIVSQKETIKRKVGIDTWQTAVIGLKRLPTSKVGTTTAAELSRMIDGTFLDITREKGRSVSDQIYVALSKILENQRGTITLAGDSKDPFFPIIEFGTVNGEGVASGSFDIEMLACDQEQITTLREASGEAPAQPEDYWKVVIDKAATRHKSSAIRTVAEFPSDTVKITVEPGALKVSPAIDSQGRRSAVRHNIKLTAQASSNLPVGTFVGRLKLASTARIPDSIPYVISAPARLATREESLKVSVKRKGSFSREDTETALTVAFVQSEGSPPGAHYSIEIRMSLAQHERMKSEALPAGCFNNGETIKLKFDTDKQKTAEAAINVRLPKQTSPGTYKGKLLFAVTGPAEMTAPKEQPFEITLAPTDWERIAPLAIPMLLLLIAGIVLYIFLYSVSQNRR